MSEEYTARQKRRLASLVRTACIAARESRAGERLLVSPDVALAVDTYLWGQQAAWKPEECEPNPVECYGPYRLYGILVLPTEGLPPGTMRWEKDHAGQLCGNG